MAGHFANQVAIVTGASSGLGWALAKELAAQGCKVGLVARRREQLETLAQEIRNNGGTAAAAAADVGQRELLLAAIHSLRDQLGPVDLLVANAGVGSANASRPDQHHGCRAADSGQLARCGLCH